MIGAPGRTRTCGPRLRRPVLYPTELRARVPIVTDQPPGEEAAWHSYPANQPRARKSERKRRAVATERITLRRSRCADTSLSVFRERDVSAMNRPGIRTPVWLAHILLPH